MVKGGSIVSAQTRGGGGGGVSLKGLKKISFLPPGNRPVYPGRGALNCKFVPLERRHHCLLAHRIPLLPVTSHYCPLHPIVSTCIATFTLRACINAKIEGMQPILQDKDHLN